MGRESNKKIRSYQWVSPKSAGETCCILVQSIAVCYQRVTVYCRLFHATRMQHVVHQMFEHSVGSLRGKNFSRYGRKRRFGSGAVTAARRPWFALAPAGLAAVLAGACLKPVFGEILPSIRHSRSSRASVPMTDITLIALD
jgi:hypothetical protein